MAQIGMHEVGCQFIGDDRLRDGGSRRRRGLQPGGGFQRTGERDGVQGDDAMTSMSGCR